MFENRTKIAKNGSAYSAGKPYSPTSAQKEQKSAHIFIVVYALLRLAILVKGFRCPKYGLPYLCMSLNKL